MMQLPVHLVVAAEVEQEKFLLRQLDGEGDPVGMGDADRMQSFRAVPCAGEGIAEIGRGRIPDPAGRGRESP